MRRTMKCKRWPRSQGNRWITAERKKSEVSQQLMCFILLFVITFILVLPTMSIISLLMGVVILGLSAGLLLQF